jgi:hypothetical protein
MSLSRWQPLRTGDLSVTNAAIWRSPATRTSGALAGSALSFEPLSRTSGGSILDCLLQDVVEKPIAGAVVGSPFRTERRPLFHLSQGGKKRAIQLSCAGSFHLGFDNELVARFRDGALRRQFLKSVLDRPGKEMPFCLFPRVKQMTRDGPRVWSNVRNIYDQNRARKRMHKELIHG